jgi:protein O-GlcNAc transferase
VCADPPGAIRCTGRERSQPGVDFAADATLADLDAATVALWAEILHRVPGSKLMLRDRAFRHPETLAELIDRFGNFGIADRVDIVTADSAEALFAEADVALLPLPYPQPATVAAALAAGIPSVCLAGEGRHRRLAASLIHHLGLGVGAIAEGTEEYARLAARLAADADARSTFRASLGERLAASEAADPRARARDLQAALERMWRETCASGR